MASPEREAQGRAYAVLRRAKGFATQRALADYVGMQQPRISQWERGRRRIDHNLLDPVLAIGAVQQGEDPVYALGYVSENDGEVWLLDSIAASATLAEASTHAAGRTGPEGEQVVPVPIWRTEAQQRGLIGQ